MARPRSDEREAALIAAAVGIIAAQGLSAPTAVIAKAAGVSNGSLFTYFSTKSDLLNRLYVELKSDMAEAAMAGVPRHGDARSQFAQVWRQWLVWALDHPDERRALALLGVSDDITAASREAGRRAMAELSSLVNQCRQTGPLKDAPLALVLALVSSIAETSMDFMRGAPEINLGDTAFDAVWRMIA